MCKLLADVWKNFIMKGPITVYEKIVVIACCEMAKFMSCTFTLCTKILKAGKCRGGSVSKRIDKGYGFI